MSFPLMLTAPSGDARLFVVEKGGTVRIIKNGALLPTPFLDITSKVSTGSEQGLLGLAFHPNYASNGIFVVNYTDGSGNTQLSTYHASPAADVADANSERPVLSFDQPFSNHNGGHVAFGLDNMLYIASGDGGSGGDPGGRGQGTNELLGSLLRLEIADGGGATIPASNPFVGMVGRRGELWNYGLRNPWRFSFDKVTGDLYIADVGQNEREEVNVATAQLALGRGANYGWAIFEGTRCFAAQSVCNSASGMTPPVLEYTHAEGCSITGGYVYRGDAIPELLGTYFYADFCEGWVRSFKYSGGAATEQTAWPTLAPGGAIPSFGQDANGELYILSDGKVLRIVKAN